jgi:hypothetical protein
VLLQVHRILIYIDGLLSVAPNCAQAVYLTFFHFPERSIALVKRLAGSPKGWNWSQPAYANKVLLQVAFLPLMDFFQSRKLWPSRCYLTFFHIPERSIALVKRLAGSPKGWNWSNLPANKVLLQVAHSYIHWWTSFSRRKLWPSRCYLTFFHFPERSIALVKRLAGSQRAEIDQTLR